LRKSFRRHIRLTMPIPKVLIFISKA
jgi:hypothetical protein